jgi:Flp pilus assembly pilin Flp/uncharacterized Zn-binding protein involved in type VI secretion
MRNLIKKFHKEESGASMVIVALTSIILLGFTALAVDLGYAYSVKVDMQSACDLAALAAAPSLPDDLKCEEVAKMYGAENGFPEDSVSAEVIEDGEKVEVTITQEVNTFFAGIIGYNNMTITAHSTAAAGEERRGGPAQYAIFSGNTAYFNGGGNVLVPHGDVHVNADANVWGSWKVEDGKFEATQISDYNKGNLERIGTEVDGHSDYVEMPDYSEIIMRRLPSSYAQSMTWDQFKASHTQGDKYVLGAGEKIIITTDINNLGDKELVIQGDLMGQGMADLGKCNISGSLHTLRTINFSGEATIDGATIICDYGEMNCTGVKIIKGSDRYCVFWANGNGSHININSTISLNGLFYAPTGEIIMNGGQVTIKGSMVAYQIGSNAGNLTVELPSDDPEWILNELGGGGGGGSSKRTAKLVG